MSQDFSSYSYVPICRFCHLDFIHCKMYAVFSDFIICNVFLTIGTFYINLEASLPHLKSQTLRNHISSLDSTF